MFHVMIAGLFYGKKYFDPTMREIIINICQTYTVVHILSKMIDSHVQSHKITMYHY